MLNLSDLFGFKCIRAELNSGDYEVGLNRKLGFWLCAGGLKFASNSARKD